MRVKEVPQDTIKILGGEKKALYALDEDGRYTRAQTAGWSVEEIVLQDALDDYDRKADEAREKIRAGKSSPIEYFMYRRRMDLITLAQAMGLFKWRVARHLRPRVFRRLDERLLRRYAELFRISIDSLKEFKEEI